MTSKILLILLLSVTQLLYAQAGRNRCQNGPVSQQIFQNQKRMIASRQGSAAQLEAAKGLSISYCLSSSQVKEIADLFGNDYDRLEYVKEAWYTVFDKEEFFNVMDAFIQASNLFRLYDFMRLENGSLPQGSSPDANPAVVYPLSSAYAGLTGCPSPAQDNIFEQALNSLNTQADDQSKMKQAQTLWQNNCFSVAQTLQMALLFQQEGARLQFLKNTANKVFDTGNLNYAEQVFPSENLKKDWNTWLAGRNATVPTSEPELCSVSEETMSRIISSLKQQSVNSSKTNLAKQQISINKCFKARQVRSIVALISVESSRLEVMKYAYDFTIDKNEYLNILDVLSVQSSRDEIIRMIR